MRDKSKLKMSEKITTRLFFGASMLCLIVSLLVGGRVVLAATDSSIENGLNGSVIEYALEHPDSRMALLLAEYILVSEQNALSNLKDTLGVVRDGENQVRTERVCYRYADSDFKFACEGWGRLTIPTATTTVGEANRLGFDAVVDYTEVELLGKVSSTLKVYAGVATSTYVAYDATAKRPDNLIDGFEFVTSTTPVQHPDSADSYRNVINSINDAGTSGNNTVEFTSTSYFVFFLQNSVGSQVVCDSNGVQCEAVTSTNRGYTGNVKYHFRYEIDL